MSDEGFHEIQLNGKQLVFLFMAATVVAVVIFLCGVMVGRGVPIRAASFVDAPGQAGLDPTAAALAPPDAPTAAGGDTAPAPAQEDLTYPTILRDSDPPVETLRPPVEPTSEVPPPVPSQDSATPPASAAAAAGASRPVAAAPPNAAAPGRVTPPANAVPPARAAAVAPLTEPPGAGFAVQVAAVRERAEATSIASRLSSKGYPAFVTTAGGNFRVRVGKYTDRREAESVAGRLEKEERFKPWITR